MFVGAEFPGEALVAEVLGVDAVLAVDGVRFNGLPTAISQRCPGWPWAGFNADATDPLSGEMIGEVMDGEVVDEVVVGEPSVGEVIVGLLVVVGVLFNGFPTGISHRCPG